MKKNKKIKMNNKSQKQKWKIYQNRGERLTRASHTTGAKGKIFLQVIAGFSIM